MALGDAAREDKLRMRTEVDQGVDRFSLLLARTEDDVVVAAIEPLCRSVCREYRVRFAQGYHLPQSLKDASGHCCGIVPLL